MVQLYIGWNLVADGAAVNLCLYPGVALIIPLLNGVWEDQTRKTMLWWYKAHNESSTGKTKQSQTQ